LTNIHLFTHNKTLKSYI